MGLTAAAKAVESQYRLPAAGELRGLFDHGLPDSQLLKLAYGVRGVPAALGIAMGAMRQPWLRTGDVGASSRAFAEIVAPTILNS